MLREVETRGAELVELELLDEFELLDELLEGVELENKIEFVLFIKFPLI